MPLRGWQWSPATRGRGRSTSGQGGVTTAGSTTTAAVEDGSLGGRPVPPLHQDWSRAAAPAGRRCATRRRAARSARGPLPRGSRASGAARDSPRSPGTLPPAASRGRRRGRSRSVAASSARPTPRPRASLGDVDALLTDAAIGGAARIGHDRDPARDLALELRDEPVLGQVPASQSSHAGTVVSKVASPVAIPSAKIAATAGLVRRGRSRGRTSTTAR